jgi:hypothetical protein
MKLYVALFAIMVFSLFTTAQNPCGSDGLCVVQFNAEWNKANSVDWVTKLNDCEKDYVDIAKDTKAAGKYKIVVVPTILIFNGSEEVGRFQANIMMTMEATKKEVQSAIDEILMEDF